MQNIRNSKKVTLDDFVSFKHFQLGMRERLYKLPPREFTNTIEQTGYEKGRLFSAALEARGETYKKYIRYNKIVAEFRQELRSILVEVTNF